MIAPFDRFSELLKNASGIVVGEDKRDFAETRLLPLARRRGVGTLEGLVERLDATRDSALMQEVVEAMTTNETFFFRDRVPFDLFRDVMLPYLLKAREAERRIRIWCNACSTGQEPYSLAMALDERAIKLAGWRVDIFATDISHSAIKTARDGLYNQFEVQRGLPVNALMRHFRREDDRWRIAEHIGARVRFQKFNLLRDFTEHGAFDIVFCRNVLIYFDQPTKLDILTRLAAATRDDGFLVLGSTESSGLDSQDWAAHVEHPGLRVRPAGPHAARRKSYLIAVR